MLSKFHWRSTVLLYWCTTKYMARLNSLSFNDDGVSGTFRFFSHSQFGEFGRLVTASFLSEKFETDFLNLSDLNMSARFVCCLLVLYLGLRRPGLQDEGWVSSPFCLVFFFITLRHLPRIMWAPQSELWQHLQCVLILSSSSSAKCYSGKRILVHDILVFVFLFFFVLLFYYREVKWLTIKRKIPELYC